MSGTEPPDGPSLWRRVVGDTDRIGWWTLPAFLAVGLAGAVMAGALAVVYYSQQVSDLESETRQARQDLQAGVDDVDAAREDALAAIEEQVDAVRDALDEDPPVDDPATLGLVLVEARVNTPAPPSATVEPQAPPAGADTPSGAVLAQEPSDPPPPTDPPSPPPPSPTPSPTSTPTTLPIEPRLGMGFAVAVEDGQTFVATSYGLVADPGARAGVVEEVVVRVPGGPSASGVVHSWDEGRGLALLQVPLGELPVADWRPRGDVVEVGDRLTAFGLTPEGRPLTVRGEVAYADVEKLVTDLPAIEFLRGAPVLDRTGRVVAVMTPAYQPFGAAAGDGQAIAPVGLFCERMLTGCDQLEAEATEPPEEQTPS